MTVTFFKSPAELRRWFKSHHAQASELWVGYYKKDSGHPSITWPESVDEALTVGWIDGIRKRVDAKRYKIRFTPRKKTSVWSAVNVKRVEVLTKEGRMRPEGLAAFEARRENRSGIYTYEQRPVTLVEPYASLMKKNRKASAFFEALPAWYRKQVTWWVVSAKKAETRLARAAKLIKACAEGRRL